MNKYIALIFSFLGTISQLHATELVCVTLVTDKHFNQTKPQVFDGKLDLSESTFTLSLARRKFRLTPNNTLSEAKLKIVTLQFYALPSATPDIILSKIGSVNDGRIPVFQKPGEGLHSVKVMPDDTAIGYFNTETGSLAIETRYFHHRGREYEYGWKITGKCTASS